jgi:hypothetical protein
MDAAYPIFLKKRNRNIFAAGPDSGDLSEPARENSFLAQPVFACIRRGGWPGRHETDHLHVRTDLPDKRVIPHRLVADDAPGSETLGAVCVVLRDSQGPPPE